MPDASHLDSPKPGDPVHGESISIEGWFQVEDRKSTRYQIRAWIDDELIGQTALPFARPDVCAALHLPATTATGFRILGRTISTADHPRSADIKITVFWPEHGEEYEIEKRAILLLPSQLSRQPYGEVVHPAEERVLHRQDIYGSGPPIDEPGAETLQLLEQYLEPGSSVLDVGCGSGAYGWALIARGHEWLGIEVDPTCCEMLSRENLPFRKNEKAAAAFPVRDSEFDNLICIEVLEHILEVDDFVSELARSIRGRALFSVPNIEVIPYFSAWQVVPWHLLEADHKNFFTRASLGALLRKYFARVEVFSYAPHPLRTPDGLPLHIHLFAVADK